MHTDPSFPVVVGHFRHISIQNQVNPPGFHFLRWWKDMKILCWLLQPTTEEFASFALDFDIFLLQERLRKITMADCKVSSLFSACMESMTK